MRNHHTANKGLDPTPEAIEKAQDLVGWTIPKLSRKRRIFNPHNRDALLGMVQPPNTVTGDRNRRDRVRMKMTVDRDGAD